MSLAAEPKEEIERRGEIGIAELLEGLKMEFGKDKFLSSKFSDSCVLVWPCPFASSTAAPHPMMMRQGEQCSISICCIYITINKCSFRSPSVCLPRSTATVNNFGPHFTVPSAESPCVTSYPHHHVVQSHLYDPYSAIISTRILRNTKREFSES